MKDKVIILDIDEVLLKWVDGFSDFLYRYWGITTQGSPKEWDLSVWLGCSKETAMEFVRSFNEESSEFGELKPFREAVPALHDLRDLGYNLYGVTASCETVEGKRNRIYNLLDVFGNVFEDVHFVPMGASKKEILVTFPKGSFYVEDNIYNVADGVDLGLNVVQYIRPHNVSLRHTEAYWADSWADIADYIRRC